VTQEYGLGVLVWSPLASGWLTGAVRAGQPVTTHRSVVRPERFDLSIAANQARMDAVEQLAKVADSDAGVASSLLNTGQQVGGSIGLAVLGTVAWSAVANNIRAQTAAAAKHASGHLSGAKAAALQKAVTDHAISVGFAKGYQVSAGIAVLALIITVIAIRVKRSDLAGIDPMAAPVD